MPSSPDRRALVVEALRRAPGGVSGEDLAADLGVSRAAVAKHVAALRALPDHQRVPLVLSHFEEMSYQDIAETMEMSPQAIKSLLSRARVNLREVLEPYLEHGGRPVVESQAQRALDSEIENL